MPDEKEKPLGAEIRCTDNLIKNYIDQTLQANLKESLTGIEGMTMAFIFRHQGEEITAKNIMARNHGSKAATSQTLNGLEKKGYIITEPSKNDRRKKVITLTAKGQNVNAEFKDIFRGITCQIKKGMTPEDEATIRRVLSLIRFNLSGEK
jgi:DNA-binding MarR family transcriptional regulator